MDSKSIKYPINLQTFESLRNDGCVYVDKTGFFPQLLEYRFYFLSRPRRFGKSLLLSTFEAYFQGKKELFQGLAIYDWEKEWKQYPIIHIDFSAFDGSDIDAFLRSLKETLWEIARANDITQTLYGEATGADDSVGKMFERLIKLMNEKYGQEVVILIDEYDKFFLDVALNQEKLKKATTVMRPFFSALKSMAKYIRFAFVTGVARFRNTTLFSGANNLTDISMAPQYATLLGITDTELKHYFNEAIQQVADHHHWHYDQALEELRNSYDGYRFTKAKEYVYNPLSLFSALASKELENYWITTGATKQLQEYLEGASLNLEEITRKSVRPSRLESTYSKENPTSLLFQTGYLTVRDYDGFDYKLGIPNQEVQGTLTELVIPEFTNAKRDDQVEISYYGKSGD